MEHARRGELNAARSCDCARSEVDFEQGVEAVGRRRLRRPSDETDSRAVAIRWWIFVGTLVCRDLRSLLGKGVRELLF